MLGGPRAIIPVLVAFFFCSFSFRLQVQPVQGSGGFRGVAFRSWDLKFKGFGDFGVGATLRFRDVGFYRNRDPPIKVLIACSLDPMILEPVDLTQPFSP